jgi:hypothetical protein
MITKSKTVLFFVDDKSFESLDQAKKFNLESLAPNTWREFKPDMPERVADWLIENAEAITDILTTTPRSRAKARKANGGGKKRKAKAANSAAPEPATEPQTA